MSGLSATVYVDGGFLRHEVLTGRASPDELVERVRRRLIADGALVALRALDGLSACELAVLAERERRARPSELAAAEETSARRAGQRESWRSRWEQMTEQERETVRARNRAQRATRRAEELVTSRAWHCAAAGCCNLLLAVKADTRFCTARCRNREKMNRYRRRKRAVR